MKTYFDTAVRENRYYSEDWTFCENWRDLGGKIWVDKRVLLKHTGSYTFDFQAQEPLYRALQAMDPTHKAATKAATEVVTEAVVDTTPPQIIAASASDVKAKAAPKTKAKKK